MIHIAKGFTAVNEAEVDVLFSNPLAFFYDPADVGNLIPDSSAFSKSTLYIWKFSVHVLLKPNLMDFEHCLANIWNDHSCVFAHFLALPFFGIGMKTDIFQPYGHCWVFQTCWHIECSTLTALKSNHVLYGYPNNIFIVHGALVHSA